MAFRSAALICGALLAFLTTARADTAAADGLLTAGPDMGAYVSPAIGAVEANSVHAALNQFPAALKALLRRSSPMQFHLAIVDGGAGRVHYNRPDDNGSLLALPPDALPGDDYPLAQPRRRGGPEGNCGYPGVPFPGCYSGSGAYRRVYTPPVLPEAVQIKNYDGIKGWQEALSNWGYWNSGTVSDPCLDGYMRRDATHRDAGYSYLGGWSTKPDTYAGTIDAGLQYNWKLTPDSKDNYSLFLKVAGEAMFVVSTAKNYPVPKRIKCGGTVDLLFWVMPYELGGDIAKELKKPQCAIAGQNDGDATKPDCASYAFFAAEMDSTSPDGGPLGAIMWIAPSSSTGAWGSSIPLHSYWNGKYGVLVHDPVVPCGNCIFKWMTSIAQKDTDGFKEDLHDGSRYAATWTNRQIAPWAVTSGLTLPYPQSTPLTAKTILCSEYPLWTAPYNASTRDCRNTPAVTGVASSISVSAFTLTGEADAISLTH